jgi:hypothetical protein
MNLETVQIPRAGARQAGGRVRTRGEADERPARAG